MTDERRALGLAYVDMLERVWNRLVELAAGFDEQTWDLPALPGWSVKDVYSHIIGTERMLAGLPADPPLPDGEPTAHLLNPLGAFNEQAVAARRRLPGAAVAAELAAITADRLATLRASDEAAFATTMDTPVGPGDLAGFLGIRVMDCWVHEQDVRVVIGQPGGLEGAEVERSLDMLTGGVPMVLGKRVGGPDGTHVRIEITGAHPRTVDVAMSGGRAAVLSGDAAACEPTTAITLDALIYTMLAAGRTTVATVRDQVTISGDRALGEALLGALNVVP